MGLYDDTLLGEKQDAESEVARLTALVHAQRDDVAVQQKEKRRLEEELANVIAHQKSLPSKIENLKLKMAEIQATIRQKVSGSRLSHAYSPPPHTSSCLVPSVFPSSSALTKLCTIPDTLCSPFFTKLP